MLMDSSISSNQTLDVLSLFQSKGILQSIGNTPLIELQSVLPSESRVKIFAKAEYLNPGGSVKDRTAKNIIYDALVSQKLCLDTTLLDASSGNTGIAYAMIGASLGIKVLVCLPKNASKERIDLLHAYGASIEFTDPLEGTDGAIQRAQEIYKENPSYYYYANQYNNTSNWKAHYNTTGEEIFSQSNGEITHFVAGLGTTGTFVGTSRKLKLLKSSIKTISFQPNAPFHGMEGLKHMETAIVPGIYDPSLADRNIQVSTEQAYEMTKVLAREEGILAGISSGAALAASLQIANGLDEGNIVTIFPDRGDRYLSENIWRN